jgi:hypothetical protein
MQDKGEELQGPGGQKKKIRIHNWYRICNRAEESKHSRTIHTTQLTRNLETNKKVTPLQTTRKVETIGNFSFLATNSTTVSLVLYSLNSTPITPYQRVTVRSIVLPC